MKSLALCIVLATANVATAADCPDAAACIDEASVHFLAGDTTAATAATRRACDLGAYAACPRVQRAVDGFTLAEKLCAKNDRTACFELARLWMYGIGTKASVDRAGEIYTKLCKKKNPSACKRAKALAADGILGDPDGETKCAEGDALACLLLGDLYVSEKDTGAAAVAYRKGCETGDAESCRKFAVALAAGSGVPKDEATAKKLLRRACDAREPDGVACAKSDDRVHQLRGANLLNTECAISRDACFPAGEALEAVGCVYAAYLSYATGCVDANASCRRAEILRGKHEKEWFPPTPEEGHGGGSAPDAECWEELAPSRGR